jgi:chemotaxis protein methyltransferase CheR
MDHPGDSISDREFRRLADLIGSQCGVVISSGKRIMLETRLRKRARALGLQSLSTYCEYLHSAAGRTDEWPNFVDVITTHKTDFFREPAHFEFLASEALPELAEGLGAGSRRPILVWSAACSTGEEPYTLAMVLSRYAECVGPRAYDFQIDASDISTAVLETARLGVYSAAAVRAVPEDLRRRYFLRSKDPSRGLFRIAPEIRTRVHFRQQNLMDPRYRFANPYDIVLCRNVLIYFKRETQQSVLRRISLSLRQGGYLLMGHSESLNGLDLPLAQVAPTVYRRRHA